MTLQYFKNIKVTARAVCDISTTLRPGGAPSAWKPKTLTKHSSILKFIFKIIFYDYRFARAATKLKGKINLRRNYFKFFKF